MQLVQKTFSKRIIPILKQLYFFKPSYIIILTGVLLCSSSCDDSSIQPKSVSPFYDKDDSKLWKHRVNCTNNADTLADLFSGIEIDLYFIDSTNSFICTHGEPCAGESLEKLILSIEEPNRKYFWLDFKNSNDPHVVSKSIQTLKNKLRSLKILDRTIIETKNPICLDSLNNNTMFSSYWVPHYYDTNPAYSNEEMTALISNTIQYHHPTVLSADYHMFDFLKTNFPNEILHLWTNGLTTEQDKYIINELRAYQNTKVVLVDYGAPF